MAQVTILILLETPLQWVARRSFKYSRDKEVTILILLETPLQYEFKKARLKALIRSQSLFYWKLLCNR